MNSYTVTYFPEDEDTLQTIFVSAETTTDAVSKVIDRVGAFGKIVACKQSGTQTVPERSSTHQDALESSSTNIAVVTTSIEFEDDSGTVEEVANTTIKPKKAKKDKPLTVKVAKVTNASRFRDHFNLA